MPPGWSTTELQAWQRLDLAFGVGASASQAISAASRIVSWLCFQARHTFGLVDRIDFALAIWSDVANRHSRFINRVEDRHVPL